MCTSTVPNIAAVLVAPDGVEQRLPGVDPLRVAQQQLHQVKLFEGQIDLVIAPEGRPALGIQANGAAGQPGGLLRPPLGAPQQRRTRALSSRMLKGFVI